MNATFSKKDSKNLDEIQATRMLMFQDDLITCTEVILILSLLEVIFILNVFLIEQKKRLLIGVPKIKISLNMTKEKLKRQNYLL